MDPKVKAKIEYLKGTKQKDICSELDISENTLKSWIRRENWKAEKQSVKGAPKNKKGAPFGSQNAKGNKGGSPPLGNKNAEKHGFYAKYLPADTLELINQIDTMNPIDILWDNIQIQYAAIIRAQKIMHVIDKDELIKHVKKSGDTSTEWEFQFAWDRQDTFLKAQSRAMGELRSMIKQYDELCRTDLVIEEQKARIEKLKADVNKIKGIDTDIEDLSEIDGEIYGD